MNFKNSQKKLPEHIQKSWERCHSKGLDPITIDKEHILGEYELKEYYVQYDEILYYSSTILKDIYQSIRGTDFLLLLATPEGYIIDALGDPSFIRHANNVALKKGANWLEESKGTNAIGTAIVEKKPILVHGSEHFWQDNHFLTCAAAPILAPDGQLLGVLNFSSHQHNYHPLTLGLVKRAAHSIEQSLLLAHTKRQLPNISADLDFLYEYHPSPLITINDEGKVTRLNFAAARSIGCSKKATIGKPISSIIKKVEPNQQQSVSFKNQVFTPHHLQSDSKDQSCILLKGETQKQHGELTNRYQFTDVISNDPNLNETIALAKKVAALDICLLISGETGTGKELFAQSIHGVSLRSNHPFIAINCSAIPESLLESELFGYEKGAFTGAKNQGHIGKFEAANGGTLFLDEIGDLPLPAQAALLRVLQEGYVTRIGGTVPRPVDVRIIAATHKDLQKEIDEGRFRADLYFRLNGFTLKLPPLRNRTDILLLAEHILSNLPFKNDQFQLTLDAKAFIKNYEWIGNFRQLKNVLQQAAVLASQHQNQITEQLLCLLCPTSANIQTNKQPKDNQVLSLREQEIIHIKQILEQTNGNISLASKQLNISRNTLYRKLKEHNIMT